MNKMMSMIGGLLLLTTMACRTAPTPTATPQKAPQSSCTDDEPASEPAAPAPPAVAMCH